MARLFFSPDSDPVSHHTISSLGKRAEKANLAAGVRTPDPLPLGVSWGELRAAIHVYSRAIRSRGPCEFWTLRSVGGLV